MKQIPTINDLKDVLANDFKTKLNLSDTQLKYVLDAMSSVLAAQFKLTYMFLSDIQNNVFPDTADLEANGGTLERLGRIYLNRNPRPSTQGVYRIKLTGTAGGYLRNSITFKSNEDSKNSGQLFILDSDYTLTGVNDQVDVRSLGGGLSFSLNVGDKLTITEPIIGVDSLVEVLSIIELPKDTEDIDVYRSNILDAIQLEPQGGSRTDYRVWSNDAQGVRKVYPYVKNGEAGTVQVFVEATTANSTDGFGTPSNSLLTDVAGVIKMTPDLTRGRIPIQANLEVLKIEIVPVDVKITGLSDNTPDVLSLISGNLKNYLYTVRPYVAGADLPRSKNDILYSGRLQSAVTDSLGSSNFFTDFDMQVNGISVNSYEFDFGFIPYLRNVIYI